MAYEPLPAVPDYTALEKDVLDWWDREGIFDKLREQNSGGERFGFLDGPITANNPMGVHHAWGRTLKDVFQRYKAFRGFDQRYQNGFDCQGLWVEVEVEKALGLNSKRDIEEYGLAEFAARCRERVAEFAEVITDQDRRLGRWMDWDNDYYTFSDTNIEYIWRFLKAVHERGWLYKGHRSTQWCPRCGTSLSQHEQAGEENYAELEHPSLYVRFPLKDREGESLVVWTTTPWTLPANVAAAVKPDAEYGLRDGHWALARSGEEYDHVAKGEELVGLEYVGPYDDLPASVKEHRVIPWDEVSLTEGTGIVHIAPGRGDRGLRAGADPRTAGGRADRRVGAHASGLRLAGGALDGRGRGRRDRGPARAGAARRGGADHAPLPDLLALQDAARLPRRRRLVHLGAGGAAAAPRRERDGRVDAVLLLEADGRLAAQHGRLEHLAEAVLRAAAAVLSVRVRRAERRRLAGRARGARHGWARPAAGAAPALDRRGADLVRGLREGGAPDPGSRRRLARRGHRPVLDARLAEPGVDPGPATRRARRKGCPARTCPTTRTGSSGSRRTGSRRAASRSGSGSTRCSSCR